MLHLAFPPFTSRLVVIMTSDLSCFFPSCRYLPRSVDHESKKKKIVNAGAVSFTLEKGTHDGKTLFRIDPSSISVMMGGFK